MMFFDDHRMIGKYWFSRWRSWYFNSAAWETLQEIF